MAKKGNMSGPVNPAPSRMHSAESIREQKKAAKAAQKQRRKEYREDVKEHIKSLKKQEEERKKEKHRQKLEAQRDETHVQKGMEHEASMQRYEADMADRESEIKAADRERRAKLVGLQRERAQLIAEGAVQDTSGVLDRIRALDRSHLVIKNPPLKLDSSLKSYRPTHLKFNTNMKMPKFAASGMSLKGFSIPKVGSLDVKMPSMDHTFFSSKSKRKQKHRKRRKTKKKYKKKKYKRKRR